jgi:hypothetical protein
LYPSIESADAVYNISGALLYKVKERTTGTFRGIDEDARNSCLASQVMFSMLAKTYRNVRGKEYATVYAEMHSRDGARSTSATRDQLAAGNYVNAQNRKNRGDT